jgi:hypothetical protein
VAALPVVEDFEVFEDCVGQFQARLPPFAVEEFGLHAAPERLDDGVDAPIDRQVDQAAIFESSISTDVEVVSGSRW